MLSLKQFHVFFITLSIALMFGFGIWAMKDYRALALSSVGCGGLLIVYLCKVHSKI